MQTESFLAQFLNYAFARLDETYLRVASVPESSPALLNEGMAVYPTSPDSLVVKLNQPTTILAIACLCVGIAAFGTLWGSRDVKVPIIIKETAEQPTKESEVRDKTPSREFGTPLSKVSGQIVRCSELLQQANSIPVYQEDEAIAMSTLAAELPMTISALCQIQQLLSLYHTIFSSQQGLQSCFETILVGLATVISSLDEELATLSTCRCSHSRGPAVLSPNFKTIEQVAQQLRDQRQGLLFVVDSMQRASQETPSESSSLTVPHSQHQQLAHTPGSDLKGFMEQAPDIEELPQYSPPRNGGELLAPDCKAPAPTQQQPVEIDSNPVKPKARGTGSIADMFAAISDNAPDDLNTLLADEIDPNVTYGRLQRTPLHECARLNRVSCAHVLFRHGAIADADDGKGDAPLHLACWEGHVEVATLLLSSDADVDRLSGRDGYSPLWCAVTARHIDVARLLLKRGARVSLKSPGDAYPLHQAAITRQSAMCELLLERGANAGCTDGEGNAPLHYSATIGDVRTAKVLLREGADVHARQERGLTPLHWAAHKGHADMVTLLMDSGASADALSGTSATPLHCAVARGHLSCVKLLVQRDANSSIMTTDWDGMRGTAEQLAVRKGYREIAACIRAAKSDK